MARYHASWGACSVKNTFLHIESDNGKEDQEPKHNQEPLLWHRHPRSGSEPPTRRANHVRPGRTETAEADERAESSEGGEGGGSEATSSEGKHFKVGADNNGQRSGSSCNSTAASSGQGGSDRAAGRAVGGANGSGSDGSSGCSPPPPSSSRRAQAAAWARMITPPVEQTHAESVGDSDTTGDLINVTMASFPDAGLCGRPQCPPGSAVPGSGLPGSGPLPPTGLPGSGRAPKQDPMPWGPNVTTVMIRQVPRTFTQRQLLEEASARGFGRLLDFAYLPFDLRKGARRCGYGFLNFVAPEYAIAFRDAFDGTYIDRRSREKGRPLRVHPAEVQGYDANYEHFVNTRVGQRNDPEFGPLFFHHLGDGQQEHCQIVGHPDGLLAGRNPVAAKDPPPAHGNKMPGSRRSSAQKAQAQRYRNGATGEHGQGYGAAGAPHPDANSRAANFCTCCGSRLKPAFKFCAFCGMGLEEPKAQQGQGPPFRCAEELPRSY